MFPAKWSSQQTKMCSLMKNSSATGKAYLNTNREEGKWVFIASMLNSVKQQMIGIKRSNSKITRRDLQSTCLGSKDKNKMNANLE